MNRTRLMATAFLFNHNNVLLLKRAEHRKLAPGLWAGIGGHLEPEEMNDPELACVREIREETGIEQDEITELKLRYILLRLKGTEIREQFVYFGNTDKQEVIDTEEGQLYWIRTDMIHSLEMPWGLKSVLDHYFNVGMRSLDQYVGVMTVNEDNTPEMQWTRLIDPITV